MLRHLLYIEDDVVLRERLAHKFRERYPYVCVASTATEARDSAYPGTFWCGFISDQLLPDGRGLSLIEELRSLHGKLPAILITGVLTRELANACTRANVQYLVKPFGPNSMDPFFEQLVPPPTEQALRAFGALVAKMRASPRETQVMYLVLLEGKTASAVAVELGISANTVKTHIRKILLKADVTSMYELKRSLTRP